jgi:hypothetical protein
VTASQLIFLGFRIAEVLLLIQACRLLWQIAKNQVTQASIQATQARLLREQLDRQDVAKCDPECRGC